MQIDRIELRHVAMPLLEPWRTAYGEDRDIHSVLCKLSSGGVEAWGESSPLAAPCYSPEWAGGVFAVADRWLAPALIGQNVDNGEQLQRRLSLFKGNPFAKAALDTAWWSLQSRITERPLHALLGATRDIVPVGADFGVLDSIDELVVRVDKAVHDGFPRIKLKYRPGWDLNVLEAVRESQPTHPIHIDCNSGYRFDDLDMFRAVDAFQLEMIEQPLTFDDLADHAQLQREIKTAVCLDESITSLDRARQAIAMGACRYVNVKPGRVGGLTPALAIHNLCRDAGFPCWVGGMLESGTGASICAALAMLDNFTYPADIFPSSRFYHVDMAATPLELIVDEHGTPSIAAPQEIPAPDPVRLNEMTLQVAVHE